MKRRRPVVIDGIVHRVTDAENRAFLGRTACRLFFTLGGHTNPIARPAVSIYGASVDCMTCIVKTGGEGCSAPRVQIPRDMPREPAQINGVAHAIRYDEGTRNAGLTLCDIRFTWVGKKWPEGHADAETATGPVDCPTCLRGGER
jgi:hypothetical protein